MAAIGLFGLAGLTSAAASAQDTAPLEKVLPASTLAYAKIENAKQFREAIEASPIGALLADPAMKPLIEDVKTRLEEASKQAQAKLGMSIEEILALPQGPATLAVIPVEGEKAPVALVISADAGEKANEMAGLMDRLTKLAQEEGPKVKVTNDEFKGARLTVIQNEENNMPLVWTQQGTTFHISSSPDALKDLLGNAGGREGSLASSPMMTKIVEKTATNAQFVWFVNIQEAFNQIGKGLESRGGANAQQLKDQLELVGLTGLKAVGGGVTISSGPYATLSKVYLHAPGEAQGILRLFATPQVDLKPEPWVPANVASYQTLSWDLDAAYKALNELLDTFAPGVLGTLEQNLAGAGGDGLKFDRDVFGPLGDRMTVVSDFKTKTDGPATQRILFGMALEDSKAFQGTFNKIMDLVGAQPAKREFQGTTIYDFEIPEMPNAEAAGITGPISVAIARDQLFAATDPSLLEMVLRGGSAALADDPDYQAVAKQFPATTSSLSFQRPEQSARAVYDMFKSGQIKQAFEQGARQAGGDADVPELFDPNKIPDFSVFAKYLSLGGGYMTPDDEGTTFTQFTLKK